MVASPAGESRVGSFIQVGIVTRYNFLNYFRARRFYVMLAIVLLTTGLFTALVAYYRPLGFVGGDVLGFYSGGWGSLVNLIVILSTAFFGGDAISSEFQNKTGYFLVPNPIRRSAIYTGKWIAALIASTIILLIFAAIFVANQLFYFPGSIPWELGQSLLYAWIYLIAALSLSFAFSSLFKSSAISILMSVILLLFVFSFVDLLSSSVAGIEPWFSITYGAGIMTDILTSPYPVHVMTRNFGGPNRGISITTYNPTVPEGLAILGAYFLIMAVVGLWLFQRKEFSS